ncbi:chromosome segregation protein SMC [Glaciecola sp. 1036]|uniref:chromosome segregation protein SMC n=1 Tax=Alteromonadaceae TaxID=72275 RepID=UPI003D082369
MRLKRIRLAGFKSFVDPTNIPFPGDMTAIVGPNGCGKSNVIDAVRWVLGESSAKNLRGDAMTDVIFNGSTARKPVSQCSVELVFDNSSGRLAGEYAGYNELSVKRIVTKEAISSYQLNGSKCRRKDITDLFLGTGLGPRSYAIIEQGMISRLIESKPQELRIFIEEAAGISKYKERRRETQNRIKHTKENLERLDDVRSELGDQLAKLKRQAAAATRYKELKQQERELKAQLATVRWLAQTEHVKQSDKKVNAFRDELNTLMSGKQGDESGIQALKNDQSVAKQKLADLQQNIYQIGNEVTRLEQSQLFAKKRLGQIQHEVEQLQRSELELSKSISSLNDEIQDTTTKIEQAEPEKLTLEAQLEDVLIRRDEIESKMQSISRHNKQQDDIYYQQKQKLQGLHGKLQQTISLQHRTEGRIAEINDEIKDLIGIDEDALGLQQAELEELDIKILQQEDNIAQLQQDFNQLQNQKNSVVTEFQSTENTQVKLKTQLEALSSMQRQSKGQQDLVDSLAAFSPQFVWQAFTVTSGHEKAFATVVSLLREMLVVNSSFSELLAYDAAILSKGVSILSSDALTSEKVTGTLASVIEQQEVPAFCNSIFVAENQQQGLNLLETIQPYQSVLIKDGSWLFKGIVLQNLESGDNKVERAAKMREIQSQLYRLDVEHNELSERISTFDEALTQQQESLDSESQSLTIDKQQYQELKHKLQFLILQQQQADSRKEKLHAELEKQQLILEEEQESLALLNEEIEILSVNVAELDDLRLGRESESDAINQQLSDVNGQYNQLQGKLHKHEMQSQQLQNSYQILSEQKRNQNKQLEDSQEKIEILQEEAETLLMPSEQQGEKLQQLLLDKETKLEQQKEQQSIVEDIDEKILEMEKGQAGINAKIEEIKAEIESERLVGESARVRAQSFIEQLAEMKQSVKDVLDSLPEGADANEYQTELEKVSASLQRLGAVNLAAVEEFEEQSVRKQHLDDQNADLTAALDTLENAMRKIDKETRARFKTTFDLVNDDLKSLFPKVFGGGSAYLALTDDDLLETGVTIMARPPGKKNSTIQLLSGGEKALTALSLVFAIFRLNPAPFCLLDEVDAPLDDANVGRFCKLVSEMSKTVQFIYITHNKVAMEMATHLTGVTMAEPGVSRMVSVDMDEALAIAE